MRTKSAILDQNKTSIIMGFFDEIKKVLFGAKAVSKSAVDKVTEKGREAAIKSEDLFHLAKEKAGDLAEDIGDTAENIWEKTIDSSESFTSKVKDKASDLFEDAKDMAENIGDKIETSGVLEDAKDFVEEIGEKVIGVAGMASEKAKNLGEKLAGKVDEMKQESESTDDEITDELFRRDRNTASNENQTQKDDDTGDDELEIAKSAAGAIGSKMEEIRTDLVSDARNISDKLGKQLDETLEKAKRLAAHEASEPEYKAPSEHLRKNALDDKDDFFKKAEAFADGRYDEVTDPFSDKPTIVRSEGKNVEKEKSSTLLPGFEDLDGDGDELIDDALLDKED
jgi:ElaB/YqjD/DUF883 family membrane-anchored ribosome-binding protein